MTFDDMMASLIRGTADEQAVQNSLEWKPYLTDFDTTMRPRYSDFERYFAENAIGSADDSPVFYAKDMV